MRPLGEALLKYAREDTHYLLFVYDKMKNELLAQSGEHSSRLLDQCLQRSSQLCLQRYEKPAFTPDAYLVLWRRLNLQQRFKLPPSGSGAAVAPQQRVFAALYDWRDRVSRREDESWGYVLTNQSLIRLASAMPTTIAALQRAVNPLPPMLRACLLYTSPSPRDRG